MQNHLNLLYREEEREMLPLCVDEGIGVIPWSPLARGRLTRDWDETSERTETDEILAQLYRATAEADRRVVDAVTQVADRRGVSRAQIALAWVMQKPGVTAPIVGATKLAHLDDAVGGAGGEAHRRGDRRARGAVCAARGGGGFGGGGVAPCLLPLWEKVARRR